MSSSLPPPLVSHAPRASSCASSSSTCSSRDDLSSADESNSNPHEQRKQKHHVMVVEGTVEGTSAAGDGVKKGKKTKIRVVTPTACDTCRR